ncbi:MAG: ribosomal protein S18-alanine N-acetyltransferase [Terracidiphilus sp.]
MKDDAAEVRVRQMSRADLERVYMIAWSRKDAPRWPKATYFSALNPDATPRRIALVAEDVAGRPGSILLDWKAPGFAEPERPSTDQSGTKSGRVVGFLVARVVGPEAELESIAVSAAEQRRGIGRRLLFAMKDELKQAGAREVLLEVRVSNQRALDFYRSLGWSEIGRRLRYYADPEEDAVVMSLKLG